MSPILTIQKRMMQLGRVRLGEKGPKGEPRKLSTFRFTSASRELLEAVAARYGGTVREWTGAPEDGFFEVTTTSNSLDIILPPVYSDVDGTPTVPYSQWFELWSGGGCQRRCDGVTESLSAKTCMCDPERRACKPTTRVSFMLPDLPGLGVWRMDSGGLNAAIELPTTLEVLVAAAKDHRFIPAVLTIQHRSKKVPDEGTRRFIVPAITLPGVTVNQIAAGDVPLALNAPTPTPPRPELPAGPPPSVDTEVEKAEEAEWGTPPSMESTAVDTPGDAVEFLESELANEKAPADEQTELTGRLLAAAERLGGNTFELADQAISRNRAKHIGQSEKHITWLKGQVTRMEKQSPQQEVLT